MSTLIRVRNASYDRYEELLMFRDQLRREADSIFIAYNREFGEPMAELFRLQVECIRRKKAISYCQMAINAGRAVDVQAVTEKIQQEMREYYRQLDAMLRQAEDARNAGRSNAEEVQQAKKIYRRIAKLIHPDINPWTAENGQLMDLWNRVCAAYHRIDPQELQELEVLVQCALQALNMGEVTIDIPDIEDKIAALTEEIETIRTTKPYTYKELLDDAFAVAEQKADLQLRTQEYRQYLETLNETLRGMISEGGVQFTWTMN